MLNLVRYLFASSTEESCLLRKTVRLKSFAVASLPGHLIEFIF